MPSHPLSHRDSTTATPQRFAFRIEKDRVLLAIGKMGDDGSVAVRVDCQWLSQTAISPEDPTNEASLPEDVTITDWLIGEGNQRLRNAIEILKTRHHIGHEEVAVSLSGDFCVTRISTGAIEQVDQELDALAGRIPRYLQLGPGGKLTGQVRDLLKPGIEHALTAVGNFTRLQTLYDAFSACDVRVAWIEPSLVSIARLIGMFGIDEEQPILIADSFGQSWEVGITHQGRLLLDYRPAAAHDAKAFANAIDQHLSRLRRFCQRHRGMDHSELSILYVGGPPAKTDPVLKHFGHSESQDDHGLRALPLAVPDSFMTIDAPDNVSSDSFAAAAAILPLFESLTKQTPPDLLQTIRREKKQGFAASIALAWWPAAAASILLACAALWVGGLRAQADQKRQQRQFVETQMRATQVRMASLQSDRRWVDHLKTIDEKTISPPMAELTSQITQCLPPRSALQSIRLEAERDILLTGGTSQEAEIYEIVGYLRRLPGIHQVALLGTTIGSDQGQSQFNIRLSWKPSVSSQNHSIGFRIQEPQGGRTDAGVFR